MISTNHFSNHLQTAGTPPARGFQTFRTTNAHRGNRSHRVRSRCGI
jgi:hypothetical protein